VNQNFLSINRKLKIEPISNNQEAR